MSESKARAEPERSGPSRPSRGGGRFSEPLLWFWSLLPWAGLSGMGVMSIARRVSEGVWPWDLATPGVGPSTIPLFVALATKTLWVLGMHALYLAPVQARLLVRTRQHPSAPVRTLVMVGVTGAILSVFAFILDPLGVVTWTP